MTEYRRILLDGAPVQVVRHGDVLVAPDGREVAADDAVHLPPSEPTKIIAVHLNYASRTAEFMTRLPATPTYFHKRPGDLLFSGTPASSRPVQPGDVVEVEGLGRLRNHVVTGPTAIRPDVGAQPSASEEVVSTALGGDWEFRGIRTPSRDLYPSTVTPREVAHGHEQSPQHAATRLFRAKADAG